MLKDKSTPVLLNWACFNGFAFFSLNNTREDCYKDFMIAILNEPPGKQKGVFLWGDLDQDQKPMNPQKGFIISSDAS